jgi:hypothetical protein
MKMTVLMAIGVVGLLAATPGGRAQAGPAGAAVYVDENEKDPAPLKVGEVAGKISGLGGDGMSGIPISLFTEEGHTLIATVVSDKNGKYRFNKIGKGLYRVVAQVPGLCPANIPIKVDATLLARHRLMITMQPKDIDTCSYGMAK